MRNRAGICIFWGVMMCADRIQSQQSGSEMDEQTKARVKQLRAISDAIKACPKVAESPDKGSGTIFFGPPSNVIWDVKPNSSARAPYLGYIEFFLPREFSASKKFCANYEYFVFR